MFDKQIFNDVLVNYKKDFVPSEWEKEDYKWIAIKCFQDNWDINADDFAGMLTKSLSKTENLLVSMSNFPERMIREFAERFPEEVRSMFIHLFDETRDVFERMDEFKTQSSIMLDKLDTGAKQHYQQENAISTYLWLKYPDKYYIYKFSEVKAVATVLKSNYIFKKGSYAENIKNFYKFYDEICEELKKDNELINLLKSQLNDSYYPDDELKTLTVDVGFYISRYYKKGNNGEWWPALEDYSPGFTKEQWVELLNNPEIIGPIWGNSLAEYFDIGGEATCSQIGEKYNRNPSSVSGNLTNLAKYIYKKTNCPLYDNGDGKNRYWPILFIGKNAASSDVGNWIWKLRPELFEALTEVDILRYLKPQTEEVSTEEKRYWWLNANPKIWSFSALAVGESIDYSLYNDNGNKRKIFQNFLDAKQGDMVIGYESTPVKKIVAICKIQAEQDGDSLYVEKVEGLSSPIDYQVLKDCPELEYMEYFVNPQGSLFKLTEAEYEFIMELIRDENPIKDETVIEKYTKEDFLKQVYMDENKYNTLVSVLNNKKNIILQGAPGVGKTFTAKRLAYSIMNEKDDDRIEFVQFHQNYSYEDFVMGYKPEEEGFKLKTGVFYQFCQKASNHPEKSYFFIIDEINRGNISRIFGELLMLIENEYRGTKATLAYNNLSFTVPKNLYIIGMMNTADRSLALIDYALRRRFAFFEMEPGFDSDGFIDYQKGLNSETFDELILRVKELNNEIKRDKSLGSGFCIGHSYFCGKEVCTDEWLHEVVDYDLIPTLKEYWFDEPEKITRWENILQGVFQ